MANLQNDIYIAQADVKAAIIQGTTAEQSIDQKMTLLNSHVASIAASCISLESKLTSLLSKLDEVVVILAGFNAILTTETPAPVVLVDVGSQQIQTEVD